ncbi:YkvA family protein [Deinococcus hopiensis]|uniref:Uncharacterized conserved protein n=1 Tax=Deinococcus hopiensis KR-140 TaxID=695939 RepID=A0A1W1VS09_9DEIO|nr:DUF1232 domain-containing protein [Deinococcus hopiensis]SMB96155.1 Uncharacterized conserved protein [Deinococcus hopiensis KR-140]
MIRNVRLFWQGGLTLLLSLGDRRVPARARLMALLALAYAISPVDLLPDAIPLLGWCDDLLVVPTVLALTARGLPAPVPAEARARSLSLQRRMPWLLPTVVLGLAGTGLLAWGLMRRLTG